MLEALSREWRPRIEARLSGFLEEQGRLGIAFNSEMAGYHLATGGKRLRALIPCWVYDAHGASSGQLECEALPLGCALELTHNATLVHDDLQDGDRVRRGQPTVWRRWSPAQAINCGDALFQLALSMACEARVEPARLRKIIQRMTRGTLEVIEGQAQEFLLKDAVSPGLDQYLRVVRGKTASLIATAVGAPLIALGADDRSVALAEDAAGIAGVIFQLQDDLLDLYGEKQRERRGSDIAEGKVSALVALLNDRGGLEARAHADRVLRKPREETTDADIREVLGLIESSGAKAGALGLVRELEARLECHALGKKEPGVHRMLLEMAAVFLEPIRELQKEVE